MLFPIYIVDAFTTRRFAGNQAAVCLCKQDAQKVAAEFNLSETAFPFPKEEGRSYENGRSFSLRWFTPTAEIPLCGHATLATAHVIFNELGNPNESIDFHTMSGVLTVRNRGKYLEMNFPTYDISSAHVKQVKSPHNGLFPAFDAPTFLVNIIKNTVPDLTTVRSVALAAEGKMLIVEIDGTMTMSDFIAISPNFIEMTSAHPEGSHVKGVLVTLSPTTPAQQGFIDDAGVPYDYTCRYFAPWWGVNEDPATGSAQCALAPFWASILKKKELYAFQAYPNRGAQFRMRVLEGDQEGRVSIAGSSLTIVHGEMTAAEA
ncbi:hypothetical protein PMAYCL1PPCAC_04767 [Pristionchus mayeri]|uniref:Epimerase n=1 Tax=Pristionchus mayeri TaxID=1317129 RepID=A0AAN4ZB87_9BILA|nr:hypothetical protein PMAYCL1PPCAC_04767 [Pristionchus mayeri]